MFQTWARACGGCSMLTSCKSRRDPVAVGRELAVLLDRLRCINTYRTRQTVADHAELREGVELLRTTCDWILEGNPV